jgi:hypothetical protein
MGVIFRMKEPDWFHSSTLKEMDIIINHHIKPFLLNNNSFTCLNAELNDKQITKRILKGAHASVSEAGN